MWYRYQGSFSQFVETTAMETLFKSDMTCDFINFTLMFSGKLKCFHGMKEQNIRLSIKIRNVFCEIRQASEAYFSMERASIMIRTKSAIKMPIPLWNSNPPTRQPSHKNIFPNYLETHGKTEKLWTWFLTQKNLLAKK